MIAGIDRLPEERRGKDVPRRFPTVHICSVDYACQILVGEDGREYRELSDSSWIEIGPVREGSVRYWGSGSHAGHINLLPLAYYSDGEWVDVFDR